MLLLETTILFFLLLTILFLFFDKKRLLFLFSLIFTILATITQYYIEGLRWQLFPCVYLLLVIYLIHRFNKRNIKWYFKTLISSWFIVAIILPVVVPVFSLPNPSGNYSIGTEIFHWVDSSRTEWFTPEDQNDYREIMVQIWYPGLPDKSLKPEPYMDFIDLRAKTIAAAGGIPSFLPSHLNLVKTNSYKNLKSAKIKTLPILIFSHGLTGSRHLHQSLFENLSSFGYAVVALDHSYDCNLTIFPDNRIADYRSNITGHSDSLFIRKKQLETRSNDVLFVLDQLEKIQSGMIYSNLNNKLNLKSVGVGGHSYGGATAILSTQKEERFQVCFALDGWINPLSNSSIEKGLNVPLLYMGRPNWDDSDYPSNYYYLNNLIENSKKSKSIIIKETLHLDYTDIPIYSPIIKYVMDVGNLSPNISISLVNELVKEFLDHHLLKKSKNNYNILLEHPLVINN